eukprot:CAMPEP_0117889716 /NCGR_PEP_ID=MMETSP0950-20121206/22786_1 /TAXON_ID=44440 /ORGANISM="Chattonella subsalsa, Strain CCMP2191" /LENGTH=430 /DNA_ID=CAMNT_0005748617 /DNA_START=44 /DNA_END=1337 /DNA_ORIENTATION=-
MAKTDLVGKARYLFKSSYGYNPDIACFAPGRVNLIGEHTDYNEGFVFPMALQRRTVVVGSGECKKVMKYKQRPISRVRSEMVSGCVEFPADSSLYPKDPQWANYVRGVVAEYVGDLPEGYAMKFDMFICSDVPLGSGLSSSAAIEVAVATFVETVLRRYANVAPPSPTVKALGVRAASTSTLAPRVASWTNSFQLWAKKGNSSSLTADPTPAPPSRWPHPRTEPSLADGAGESPYAQRVRQCKEAVAAIQTTKPEVKSLRDASIEDVENIKSKVSDLIYRRARHVVTENDRCQGTADALTAGDYKIVGTNMYQSHYSLKDDYEVSCEELDILVDIASKVEGVYGSRMTGGGFGGCTVTLVAPEAVDKLTATLKTQYREQTGKECVIFVTTPGAGASEIVQEGSNRSIAPLLILAVLLAFIAIVLQFFVLG